jgi:molecular chaperone GrpE (heat shock protein)
MAESVEQGVDGAALESAPAPSEDRDSAVEQELEAEAVAEPSDGESGVADGDQDRLAESVVEQALTRLDTRLEESQRLLGRQTDLVDKLHAENQDLRAGEIRTAQLTLVRDLLRLHDDVARMRAAAGESADDLRLVQESLVDALSRNGIESFAPERGEAFDPTAHTVSGIERTDDEHLDKAVAEVTKRGFRWDSGDLIRVAEVRAYRYAGPG